MNKGFVAEFDAYRHLGWYYCHKVVTAFSTGTTGEQFVRDCVLSRFCRTQGVVVDDLKKVEAYAKEQAEIFLSNHPRSKAVSVEVVERWGTTSLKVGGQEVIRFFPLISVFLSDHVTYHSDDLGVYEFVEFPHKKRGQQ